MQNQHSIKTRILLTFTLLMALFIGILARGGYLTTRRIYLDEAQNYLRRLTVMIGKGINTKYLPYLLPEANNAANVFFRKSLRPMVDDSGVSDIFVFDKRKRILFSTGSVVSSQRLYLSKTEIESLLPGSAHVSVPFVTVEGTWYLWGFYRLNTRYFVGVREAVGQLEQLNNLGRLFLLIAIGALLVVVVASFIIARSIAAPIEKLVDFSTDIARRDFAAVLPPQMGGELAILRDAMVQMQADIRGQNELRKNMLAQIAHEIRNPLGGVELLSGLIEEDAVERSEIHKNAQKIRQQVCGLKNQLTAFLEYSRPVQPQPEILDLSKIPPALGPSLSSRIKGKNIQFNFDGLRGRILFDRGQLHQVLLNLLANALEAIRENGDVQIYSVSRSTTIRIVVEDSGRGVADADRDKLFKPFFTTRGMGTGLGLAVCLKLCHANGAALYLDSDFTNGARFVIELQNKEGA